MELPVPKPASAHPEPEPTDESAGAGNRAEKPTQHADPVRELPWDPASLAGRLVEITGGAPSGAAAPSGAVHIWDIAAPARDTGSASLTAAVSLLAKVQQLGEPAAWINARTSSFFPPDLEESGIDLAALVVVRTKGPAAASRAADKLLRSGAFGLVVLDLGAHAVVPAPLLSRLLGLAQKHNTAVVFLTEKSGDAASLAPIVSLRVAASRRRIGSGRFACTVVARKDKRRAPGWSIEETFRGPPGLH